jgi:hypothetical protein
MAALNPEVGKKRISVDFSNETYEVLKELAKGGSIADALRDAIALTKWFKDTQNEGKTILVEDRNGKLREVIKI